MSRSYSCEIPQTPNSSHATTRSSIASTISSNSQMSHPSPTPSSASSSSNSLSVSLDGTPGQVLYRPHRPRFGQTSPKQLRKLLALSDGAVIVPHSNSSNNNNNSNNSGTGNQGNAINQTSHSHLHHHHNHQHNNSGRISTNTNNFNNNTTNITTSSNYYNNHLYGCHPHHSQMSVMNNNSSSSNAAFCGNGNLSNTSTNTFVTTNNNGGQTKATYSGSHIMNQPFTNACCPMLGTQLPSCCTSGTLFPNQPPYCSCCNCSSMLRPSMIMMHPQTSGLMHSTCSCLINNRNQSGRRQNSLPPKQSLPVESSSVTSLRRLDQYQHITRNRNHKQTNRRPQCPDYDTTMQRICGGNSVTINGNLPNQNTNTIGSKHRPSQHHREDIV